MLLTPRTARAVRVAELLTATSRRSERSAGLDGLGRGPKNIFKSILDKHIR